MDISIIIPNYNGEEILKNNFVPVFTAVDNYAKKQKAEAEIIVVDDGSVDESIIFLQREILKLSTVNKNVKLALIVNKKNLGFPSAVNRGAFTAKGKFLIFLNTDVIPRTGFLDYAVKDFQNDEKLFGVGFLDESLENGKVVQRGRGIGSWNRGFMLHEKGDVTGKDTFWVSGGSSMIRRDIFLKLNGFDEIYSPFYWEDIDLSYRAKKMGFKTVFEKKSVVIHRHFEGAIKKHYSDEQVKTIAYRNQFIFVWKNITDFNLILSHLLWLPVNLIRAILTGEKALLVGFFLALKGFPDIIKKRKKQKRLFILRDKDILNNKQ